MSMFRDPCLCWPSQEDSNVIVVDWGRGARMPFYQNAVANTRLVGTQLRLLLLKLEEEAGLRLDTVHLIGHSLGAHTSGYTGRDLDKQLRRITGKGGAIFVCFSYPRFGCWHQCFCFCFWLFFFFGGFFGWLLNVPATWECISGTDLHRQLYVLPHWDRSCRSNFPSDLNTVNWHLADQSQHWI